MRRGPRTAGSRFIAVGSMDWNGAPSPFSNAGFTVLAPGGCVRSTELDDGANYDATNAAGMCDTNSGSVIGSSAAWVDAADSASATNSGTSFAAPFVTGLAAALWSIDPSLSASQINLLITGQGYTQPAVGGVGRRIDAFAAVLGIDALKGDQAVQSALCDVDDGTMDGNQRARRDDNGVLFDPLFQHDAAFLDGTNGRPQLRGDGQIGMADFRAFRDALLQVEAEPATLLDGDPAHSAFDLNRDGLVEAPAGENRFPRFDFNGDGLLSRTAVPGDVGLFAPAHFSELTDLDVLMQVWPVEPALADGVAGADLPDLLDSGDVEIVFDGLLIFEPSVLTFTVTLGSGGTVVRTVTLPDECQPGGPTTRIVMTLPAGVGHGLTVTSDAALGIGALPFDLGLGEDRRFVLGQAGPCTPACGDGEICCAGGGVSFCVPAGNACPRHCVEGCDCPAGASCCASLGNICVPDGQCGGEACAAAPTATPKTLIVGLDASGSMQEETPAVLYGVENMLNTLGSDDRVILVAGGDVIPNNLDHPALLTVALPGDLTEEEQENVTGLLARTRAQWASFVVGRAHFVLVSDEDGGDSLFEYAGALWAAGFDDAAYHAITPLPSDVGQSCAPDADYVGTNNLALQSSFCGQSLSICGFPPYSAFFQGILAGGN